MLPVRLPKDIARRLNVTLGRPLAPKDELENRGRARARLADLRSGANEARRAGVEQAPLIVYFEKDRNVRELVRIEEMLSAKGVSYKRLDVAGDEATIAFVTRKADCERDDLPVVFVADHAVGGYTELVAVDVAGELDRMLRSG